MSVRAGRGGHWAVLRPGLFRMRSAQATGMRLSSPRMRVRSQEPPALETSFETSGELTRSRCRDRWIGERAHVGPHQVAARSMRESGVPWVIKRRWWMLAAGVVLLLLGFVPSDPWSAVRDVFLAVGSLVIFWTLLAILFAVPMALRARREAPRPPD